ncbi:MAG: hypothetical protein COV45_09415 [Deltaproteobacteria bacterium CG11_big_fil_rev_8_21_14_0_20_47_16]|nr:MAG: hypothetical protein COV45_09415 [Deltaproteobacteria bacterium CG11_big_fil_rev_8_21_14_0_20_47_16]
MAAPTLSTTYPQVWHVRIPDPACTKPLSQCQSVAIPIQDPQVQTQLWSYDLNGDNVLDWRDLEKSYSANGAIHQLSAQWISAQNAVGSASLFKSEKVVIDWARFDMAVHAAYNSVQDVDSLQSHHVDEGFWNSEHQFNANDWQTLTRVYGANAELLVSQMQDAYTTLWSFTKSAGLFSNEIVSIKGIAVDRKYIVDPAPLPAGMRQEFTALLNRMSKIDAFYGANLFMCVGKNCPVNSTSTRPLVNHSHNGQILTCSHLESTGTPDQPECSSLVTPQRTSYSHNLTFPKGVITEASIPYPAAL